MHQTDLHRRPITKLRFNMSFLVVAASLLTLIACAQPEDRGLTSEELRSVVQEAVAESWQTAPPAGPSTEKIRAIVKEVVDEAVSEVLSPEQIRAVVETAVRSESLSMGRCGASLNSCDAGSFSNLDDTPGEYQWRCVGANGGLNATCSKPKPELSQTCSAGCGSKLNSCYAGSFGNLDDTPEHHKWQCLADGGLTATCSLRKSGN